VRSRELPEVKLPKNLAALEAKAKAAWLPLERGIFDDEESEPYLVIEFPNGRRTRSVLVTEDRARSLLSFSFEKFRFLGDYEAVVNADTGAIEARINNIGRGLTSKVWQLPGVEVLNASSGNTVEELDADMHGSRRFKAPADWRLAVRQGACEIELSPASKEFAALTNSSFTTQLTVKVRGIPWSTHEESLKKLDELCNAFFFDLDLRYDLTLGLVQRRQPQIRRARQVLTGKPNFPANKYAPEPLALYQYGRSASALPLLEFLAYYQAVEYFFPYFAAEETLRKVTMALRDPRFQATDEAAVSRVIRMAASASPRIGPNEREQLKMTVRACVEPDLLLEFIQSSNRVEEHFCSKNQAIRGVNKIYLTGSIDVRDQVAERIYTIRCRIVHTKQEGGDSGVELLLPSSRESRSLSPDVDLLRIVARQALMARSSPLRP
jgi:hypothetical protein